MGGSSVSLFIRKRELKDGRVRYYLVAPVDGKQKQLGGYDRKKEANAAARRVQNELANGTFGQKNSPEMTFGDFYADWIRSKSTSLKASTNKDYQSTFRNHVLPYFSSTPLSEITTLSVQEWINELSDESLSAVNIDKTYRYFRACMNQAERWELIDKCPCRSINKPRIQRPEVDCLGYREVDRLLQYTKEPERTLFAVLAFSGLRLGEAQALAWRHIDFRHRAIIVERSWNIHGGFQEPKTRSSRRAVKLMPHLQAILEDHCRAQGNPAADELVFSLNGSRPLDQSNAYKELQRALKEAGLKRVNIHSFRHSFATLMLECNASIRALQHALGHSTPTLTLGTYAHLLQEDISGALQKADQLVSGADGKLAYLHERKTDSTSHI